MQLLGDLAHSWIFHSCLRFALHQNGSSRSPEVVPPLHEAADKGHGEICRVLLAAGAQVDARDDSGLSALKRWTHGAWGRFQVANKIRNQNVK